jgi:histidine triad (HIT) family protein
VTLEQLRDSPFDKIIKGEARVQAIFEDEKVVVFPSKRPCANVHFIVLAKSLRHHSMTDVDFESEEDKAMLGHMMVVATQVARNMNLQNGYRIVSNNGKNAYQTIHNLYIHVIGGQ